MEFNKVTPEIVEQLKAIAPGRAFAGDEINEDYAHDEMRFYGQKLPDVVVRLFQQRKFQPSLSSLTKRTSLLSPEEQVPALQAALLLN